MGVLTSRASNRVLVAALLAAAGCVPPAEDDSTLVDGPRVLAVRMLPAEAEEGDAVSLEALWSSPVDDAGAPIDWAICRDRKPLAELGPVNPSCLEPAGDGLMDAGMGLRVDATMPDDACRLFGPSPPEAEEGEPAGRPVDPDPTGGFYVPIRVGAPDEDGLERVTIAEVRVACEASGTTREQSAELRRRYVANENPVVALEVYRAGDLVAPDAEGRYSIAPSERVLLVARWDVTETYVRFDRATRTIVESRESMRVSWLSTAGTFDEARSGIASDDPADGIGNGWVAPSEPADVRLWAVARDERGGTSWLEIAFRVTPG